ncbi:hypothetical protein AAY473_001219, partial [Plecturocebus cupreus]
MKLGPCDMGYVTPKSKQFYGSGLQGKLVKAEPSLSCKNVVNNVTNDGHIAKISNEPSVLSPHSLTSSPELELKISGAISAPCNLHFHVRMMLMPQPL